MTVTLAHGEVAFSEERADRAQRFIEGACVHTKGHFARKPFILGDWQRDQIVRPLFGTVMGHALHGLVRLYTLLWLELARKNGKSELLAALALLLIGADDEEEAEVYGAARDRDQASMVFNVAARMVELSPTLSARYKVIHSRKRIIYEKTASTYQVIAADAGGSFGQNPHGVIFDEIHTQPNRELFDALTSAEGTRAQPLIACATTAGVDADSFAANEHTEMIRVMQDPPRDPRTLSVIHTTDPDADPFDESIWRDANPALFDPEVDEPDPGKFKDIAAIRNAVTKAKNDPTKLGALRVFQLNQWGHNISGWMDAKPWDTVAGMLSKQAKDYTGRATFGGLDLAATSDLVALAWLFPPDGDHPRFEVLPRFWTPRAAAEALAKHTGGVFDEWASSGFITITDGEVVDYDRIHKDIKRDAEHFDVRGIAADRWNSVQTVSHLEQAGLPVHTVGAAFGDYSPGMKELMHLVQSDGIRHGGHPVLRWCVLSAQAEMNYAELIRPRKIKDRARSKVRIDGLVALVLALGEFLRQLSLEEDKVGAFTSIELLSGEEGA